MDVLQANGGTMPRQGQYANITQAEMDAQRGKLCINILMYLCVHLCL